MARNSVVVGLVATVGGALGSFLERNLAVREAIYRYHPDEDAEVD